jgi:glycosyltransferase involved in cell wall biosynthesis
MTAHEIDCNGGFEKQNNWLLGKLFQYGIRHADCIVTQSKEHAGMIQQHHKRESLVIPSLYAIPTEEELARVEKKHVLWVGRCEDWKRPEVFIDLAEKHPTETFVMISPVSNNQSAYYTQLKERLAHAPANLTHIPYVPFAEIDQYFKEAKVFVNTSTYEGFPNTFLQAMKNKTPILSLVVNPDNILTTQQCGLQANNNTETLQQQLTTLLQNTSDRTQLGENGYRYCAARHASAHIAKQYTALFQKMLGRDRL